MEPTSIKIIFDDETEMLMNRTLLTEKSEYFAALFRSGMKEMSDNCVNLSCIDSSSAKVALNFLKDDNVELDPNNAMSILEASLYFEIPSLQEKCFRYLSANSISRLKDLLELSQQINKDRLAVLAIENAAMNFQTVIDCEYSFPLDLLRTLLASERLVVSNDYRFARYIVQFIADEIADPKLRETLSLELMSHVSLCSIPIHCLMSLYYWSLVSKSTVIGKMIKETYLFHMNVVTSLPLKPYLTPRRTDLNVYACDKRVVKQVTIIRLNNPESKPPVHRLKRFDGRGKIKRTIWAFGFLYMFLINDFLRFDPIWDRWVRLRKENILLEKFTLVVFENFIYKIGGQNGLDVSASVERFSPQTNSWVFVCSLDVPTCELSAVIYEEQLVINGGITYNMEFSRSVLIYEADDNEWRSLAPMNYGRYGHQSVVFGGKLYVFGGSTFEGMNDKTSEVFNLSINQWTVLNFDVCLKFNHIWTDNDELFAIEEDKIRRAIKLVRIDVQTKRTTDEEYLPLTCKAGVIYSINRNS